VHTLHLKQEAPPILINVSKAATMRYILNYVTKGELTLPDRLLH
jgi:hypothetical protein